MGLPLSIAEEAYKIEEKAFAGHVMGPGKALRFQMKLRLSPRDLCDNCLLQLTCVEHIWMNQV